MISVIAESITVPLIFVGLFFFLIGSIGLLRFPDIYCRIHVTSKCDTVGAGAILVALAIYEHHFFVSMKLLIICFLIFVYSPTAGHIIARTAYRNGMVPWRKQTDISYKDEKEE